MGNIHDRNYFISFFIFNLLFFFGKIYDVCGLQSNNNFENFNDHHSSRKISPIIDLQGFEGSLGFSITGENPGDRLGFSVVLGGDLNGDGKADLLLGAPLASSGKGAIYIVYGSSSLTTVSLSSGFNGLKIDGSAVGGTQFGYSVDIGDANGDGKVDFIVGAPAVSSSTGTTYLFFGKTTLTSVSVDSLASTSGVTFTGPTTSSFSGSAVSLQFDVNKDGKADPLIGAHQFQSNQGRCYFTGGSSSVSLSSLSASNYLTGATVGSKTSFSIASGGDATGDGAVDVLIGSPGSNSNTGIVYLIYGNQMWNSMFLSSLASTEGIAFNTASAAWSASAFGTSIDIGSDVNGDSRGDILIGAPGYGSNAGAAVLIFGRASTFPSTSLDFTAMGTTAAILFAGAVSGERFGTCVSIGGDFNGDGKADFAVGAPGYANSVGRVYLIFGKAFTANVDLSTFVSQGLGVIIVGESALAYTGYSVSLRGDVNGDAKADLLIGAYGYRSNTGRAYLIYGTSSTATVFVADPTSQPSSQPSRQPTSQPVSDPSSQPTSQPSREPTQQPTSQPSREPTSQPTDSPTTQPTSQPSAYPSQPSCQPSAQPTATPSGKPSSDPTSQPTIQPSQNPTSQPTSSPTMQPSSKPSLSPSSQPSGQPSILPSCQPSIKPSAQPSCQPSSKPTFYPTTHPSGQPTSQPSEHPTVQPSSQPSAQPLSRPSCQPTSQPSKVPTTLPTAQPSIQPTLQPFSRPSLQPSSQPSFQPSSVPSAQPTQKPSSHPSSYPTCQPSAGPSVRPSLHPTRQPTGKPSSQPTGGPTTQPSRQPSIQPTSRPTSRPTNQPSCQPSSYPSTQPTKQPSSRPSTQPTQKPSSHPSSYPTCQPSAGPSVRPSLHPTRQPTGKPSSQPTGGPTTQPSRRPSIQPTSRPTSRPTNQPSCQPSSYPSTQPTKQPVSSPSSRPTNQPSFQPSSLPSAQPSQQPIGSRTSQPSSQPTRSPSSQPSTQPSRQPSNRSTAQPSSTPTRIPSSQPTRQPTVRPSCQPSSRPSAHPSRQPSSKPTSQPSSQPSVQPSVQPSSRPSSQPSQQTVTNPSGQPSCFPTSQPSQFPSSRPSCNPSSQPSIQPSALPSSVPSCQPSGTPLSKPTSFPTYLPSSQPTLQPTSNPSLRPSAQPSSNPTNQPSSSPSGIPSVIPSSLPSRLPTTLPSSCPSSYPLSAPSIMPSCSPSSLPSNQPTIMPTSNPSELLNIPTMQPLLGFQIPTAVSSSSISIFALPRQFKSSLFLFGTNSPTSSTILQNVELPRNFIGNHFVLLGKKGGYKNLNLLEDSVPNVFSVSTGGVAQGSMTRSISNIGDINRDGIDDFIFGDPLADRCYVYLPEAASNLLNMKVSFMIMPDISMTKRIGLGWATAGIGNFNHDNYNDFIITAPTINTAYIIYGRSRRRFPNPLILSMLTAQTGMIIVGNTGEDRNFGMAVSSAGDFNGDGYVDILISAMRASSSSQSNVYVILGVKAISQKNMTVMLNSQSSLQYVQITTPRSSFSGMSISGIGDFNGDGLDDVAVGSAPYQSVDAQSTFIVYGKPVLATSYIDADVIFMDKEDGVVLTGGGFMVSGLGDVNGDGLGDLMVSSYSGWLGKGNAYLTVYPSNFTSSPSFSPTSMPSTVSPSSIPTLMSSPSSFPSLSPSRYIPPSQSAWPSIAKTIRPSSTSSPSKAPSMKPTRLRPTRRPTLRPSQTKFPSRKPVSSSSPTTSRPSHAPRGSPSSYPSSFPTVSLSTPLIFDIVPIHSPGYINLTNYFIGQDDDDDGGHSVVIGNHRPNLFIGVQGNVTIGPSMRGKRTIYSILPVYSPSFITISSFQSDFDLLNISAFIEFHEMSDLLIASSNPLTIVLSQYQRVILSSHRSMDLSKENFLFTSVGSSSTSRSSIASSFLQKKSGQIAFVVAIILLSIALAGGSLFCQSQVTKAGKLQKKRYSMRFTSSALPAVDKTPHYLSKQNTLEEKEDPPDPADFLLVEIPRRHVDGKELSQEEEASDCSDSSSEESSWASSNSGSFAMYDDVEIESALLYLKQHPDREGAHRLQQIHLDRHHHYHPCDNSLGGETLLLLPEELRGVNSREDDIFDDGSFSISDSDEVETSSNKCQDRCLLEDPSESSSLSWSLSLSASEP